MDCYICGKEAELLPRTLEGDAVRCLICGDYEISGTLPQTTAWQNAGISQRLRALENAKRQAPPGRRPKLTSYSL
jgi:hypothetical protein